MPGLTAMVPQNVGLQYRPLSRGRSLAAGGLQGIGAYLMALGAGQPQQAPLAFQAGLQNFQEDQYRREQRAREDALYAERSQEKQDAKDEKAANKAEIDALIDKLNLPPDAKIALRTGLADWGDVNPKPDTGEWKLETFKRGNQEVTAWVNPLTQEVRDVSQGPAYAPQQGDGGPKTSLVPFYTTDKDGKVHMFQPTASGVPVEVQLPPGMEPTKPVQWLDTGTAQVPVQPLGGLPAGNPIQKDVAGKAAQEEIGTSTGKVAAGLPDAIAKAEEATALIESLKTHPGREQATGFSSIVPAIPGGDTKDFLVKLDQLKGTVFLQAYSQLKGGGAITEIEGQKAEQAIARLNTAQSEGEFVKSLDELKDIINAGIARMKSRAGGAPYATPPTPTAPTGPKIVPELTGPGW